jgi:large repetitive protein
MRFRPSAVVHQGMAAAITAALACLLAPATARAQNVYITNSGSDTVSVIATATNTVVGSPITVGDRPGGAAMTRSQEGSEVYVTNQGSGTVSVIATATDTVVGPPITVGSRPYGMAVTPDGSTVYVVNQLSENSENVLVINAWKKLVVGSLDVPGSGPYGVAITPDGSKLYVANSDSGTVSVIATATNSTVNITVGERPSGVALGG